MTRDDAPFMDMPVMAQPAGQLFDVLLMPVSRPELGEIRIGDDLFAIGRGEAPFAAYPSEAVSVLSRRHARIFSEDGSVYVADLGSKNGTRVNGDTVAQQPALLRDGDELNFGAGLSYRVRLYPRPPAPEPPRVAVTLTPVRDDLGLQPVVIARFPFMVNKTDETFARYRSDFPHQVNYLSRRHAHVYLKHGVPWVEDLGSTNGTFVNGVRLRDQSIRLESGDVGAFGGSHFVYRVSVEHEADADATATRTSFLAPAEPARGDGAAGVLPDVDPDKTTFVGAPDSFLDIFCVDYRAAQEDEVNPEALPDVGDHAAYAQPKRGRVAMMIVEALRRFGIRDRHQLERAARIAVLAISVIVVGGTYIWWRGAPDRTLHALIESGEYARAAEATDTVLAVHPDNAQYQALGAEALMRGFVPAWSARLQANDFAGADAVLGQMCARSQHNREGQALIRQLAWVGDLERFVVGRGGIDAPIRLYTDEAKIRDLLRQWGDDTAAHQRLLGRIATDVPPFRDTYARALSDLRRLQNDDSVYLAAIDRLNTAIATELARDQPEALQAMLAEYQDKYPRLAGLDRVSADLKQYTAIMQALRERAPAALVAHMRTANLSTPPFQAAYQALRPRLPGDDVLAQYAKAEKAWEQGDSATAVAALRSIKTGPWAADIARDAARREQVARQFAAVSNARGSAGYDEQLLALYASLDPHADAFFTRAVEANVETIREGALRHANTLLNRAATNWRQYRNNGLISSEQRLEAAISPKFRAQAKLLADAQDDARQGLRIYTQLKIDDTEQWTRIRDDIQAEIDAQRRALNELRMVLDPAVLKAKLALLGEGSNQATAATTGAAGAGGPATGATANVPAGSGP